MHKDNTKSMDYDIYICYTEPDKAIAEEICQAIEQQKISCWLNSRNVDMSKSYVRSIIEAINNCKCVIVIMSDSANESSQIEYEIDLAYKNNKTIISFVIENISINNVLNYYLSSKNRIIAYPNYSNYTKTLLESVCNLLGKEYSNDEDLMPYISNGKVGYINRNTMEIVIPCKFSCATKFKNGFGLVKEAFGWYIIDKQGNICEDYCFVDKLDTLTSYIDCKGDLLYEAIFSEGKGFGLFRNISHGYCPISNKEYKWGIIDLQGNIIVDNIYDYISKYDNGYFVIMSNNKLGVIDKYGTIIVNCKFDIIDNYILDNSNPNYPRICNLKEDANLFGQGTIKATQDNNEFTIDNKGNIINFKQDNNEILSTKSKQQNEIVHSSDEINKFTDDRTIVGIKTKEKHTKYGLIGPNEENLIPFKYDKIIRYNKELFIVANIHPIEHNFYNYGFCNKNGKKITENIYISCLDDKSSDFPLLLPNGLIIVERFIHPLYGPSASGVINQEGEEIIPCKHSYLKAYPNGTFESKYIGSTSNIPSTNSIFYDSCGKEITLFEFVKLQKPKYNIFLAKEYSKYGVFHTSGYCIIPPKYYGIEGINDDFHQYIYDIVEHGISKVKTEYGYNTCFIDTFGNDTSSKEKLLFPSISNDQFGYSEFVWETYLDNHAQKITTRNRFVWVEHKYELAYQIVNEFGRVKKNGNWGFVNSLGKEITPFIYTNLRDFYQGRAGVCSDEGLWGFVDVDGKEIIKCQFQAVEDFCEGLCKVENDNLWGFIDRKGNIVISCQYEDIRYFSEGLSAAQINKKWGYIDNSNNVIIPFIYDEVSDFKDGISRVKYNEERLFIDTQGKEYSFSKYNVTSNFSEGLALVIYRQQFGCINKKGDLVIPFKYAYASIFEDGCSIVKRKGKFGVINQEDTELISCKYDKIWKVGYNLFALKQDNQCALSNTNGEVLTEFKYNTIHKFANGLACVKKNKEWGYINEKGEEVIECKYETAIGFYCGFGQVISRDSNGKTYSEYIDKEGRTVNSNKCFTNKA